MSVRAVAAPGLWLLFMWAWGGGCREWEHGVLLSVAPQISATAGRAVAEIWGRFLPSKLGKGVGCEEGENAWVPVLLLPLVSV